MSIQTKLDEIKKRCDAATPVMWMMTPSDKRFGRLKYFSRKHPGMVRVYRLGDKHPSNWHESYWRSAK